MNVTKYTGERGKGRLVISEEDLVGMAVSAGLKRGPEDTPLGIADRIAQSYNPYLSLACYVMGLEYLARHPETDFSEKDLRQAHTRGDLVGADAAILMRVIPIADQSERVQKFIDELFRKP